MKDMNYKMVGLTLMVLLLTANSIFGQLRVLYHLSFIISRKSLH